VCSLTRDVVLVTGGAGFIGATLVRHLLAAGRRVRVVDSGEAAGFAAIAALDLELVAEDIRTAPFHALLGDVEAVVHLAARTSVPDSIVSPLEDHTTNVTASMRLLEASRLVGVRRFVFASSCAADPWPADGDGGAPAWTPSAPVTSPYGAGKLAVEAYLAAYHAAYGMVTTSLRIANPYGPWSTHKTSVVAAFISRALRSEALEVAGDGHQTRDLIHVGDVAEGIAAVVGAPADAVGGRVLRIGTGRETSVRALAERILALSGRDGRIRHIEARAGETLRSRVPADELTAIVGWQPRVTLDDGLCRTIAWFESRALDRGTAVPVGGAFDAYSDAWSATATVG
jgi:UDP-glucose 4-epimerase